MHGAGHGGVPPRPAGVETCSTWVAARGRLAPILARCGPDAAPGPGNQRIRRAPAAWSATSARCASDQLGELRFDHRFDLIVCADVLHYLRGAEIERGLPGLVANLAGMAFIEVYTAQDRIQGDPKVF